jgi:hypothetical protein
MEYEVLFTNEWTNQLTNQLHFKEKQKLILAILGTFLFLTPAWQCSVKSSFMTQGVRISGHLLPGDFTYPMDVCVT